MFPDPLEIGTDFRPLVGLIGQANQRIPHVLVLDGRIASLVLNALDVQVIGRVKRIAYPFIYRDVADGAEEPQTIFLDRTADVEVEVLDVIDEVAELEAPIPQVVSQVVRLPARRRA